MKKLFLAFVFLTTMVFTSCTKQERVRNFGGTEEITVEPGYRVMMATWKGSDLFYMIEEMPDDYQPHNKMLVESSAYGIIETTIVFKESR